MLSAVGQSSLRFCTQTSWRASEAKSLAVKSLAELVSEHRQSLNMNAAEYARHVGTSRQNINNVEAGETLQPRFLGKLAKAMGRSVDELMGAKTAAPFIGARESEAQYITVSQALPVVLEAIAHAPDPVREELAQALVWLARKGNMTYAKLISDLLSAPPMIKLKRPPLPPAPGGSPAPELDKGRQHSSARSDQTPNPTAHVERQ